MAGSVTVGYATAPHGFVGTIRFSLTTDFPERLRLRNLYILRDTYTNEIVPLTAVELRIRGKHFTLRFREIESYEEARRYKGWLLEIDSASVPNDTEEDEYYFFQLTGLMVIDEQTQTHIGKVINVIPHYPHKLLDLSLIHISEPTRPY